MKHMKQIWTGALAGLAMILLILDSQTALSGAKDSIQLCLYTVIPSLFPFFILSSLINSALLGRNITLLRPICKLCGIPDGAGSLLLLGFLGGYPVGAQAITEAYKSGQLRKDAGSRLLGFCSNAGPAFIFGMVSTLFTSRYTAWILWLIHMLSALIVGTILPGKGKDICRISTERPLSIPQALEQSIKIMANVCGWVIAFRVILAVCDRWFLWLLPQEMQILFIGVLELSNGCVELRTIQSEGTRFVLSACMLGLGGLCVGMQTVSVTKELGTGMYFPGKILQCVISFLLAGIAQVFLFAREEVYSSSPFLYAGLLGVGCILTFFLRRRKKVVAMSY